MATETTTPATVFQYQNEAQTKSFDVAPLLQQLERTSPAEMACELEEAIASLTDYQLMYNPMDSAKTANMLTSLRTLRNALLTGAKIIQFSA